MVLQFDALNNLPNNAEGQAINLPTSTHFRCAFLSVVPHDSSWYPGRFDPTHKKGDTLEKTLAHEIGHHLFLPHAYSSLEPPNDQQTGLTFAAGRHDHSDPLCMMTYQRDDLHFCGLCVLRLRGWSTDPLHNDGKQNKKP